MDTSELDISTVTISVIITTALLLSAVLPAVAQKDLKSTDIIDLKAQKYAALGSATPYLTIHQDKLLIFWRGHSRLSS